ncbi:MAG: TonB-dependent receptor [Rhodothermales bacterium]|nr:TonB-dependent receptor [Rhodothermales bacterium]MBO6780015.1 TonB-dependent receptor [Rhodothermales bacterium]
MGRISRWLPLAALLLWMGYAPSASADTNSPVIYGKIAGTVIDATTGDPLPGVNVVIDGTTQGSVTDLDGQYQILRVRPGTYAVRASFIGFASQLVENVEVIVDKTTRVDFNLAEEVFEGQEVVITAERGVVQVDRTTTTAVVNSEQLEALPVTSLNDAVNLQAGVVDGRFRGGRSGEVAYLVNGVPINNAFNNQAAFEVEQNMVESLEVISGVFNAEYGQAQSGVVNIVTKDVPDRWSGSFLSYIGTIASGREVEFLERTVNSGSFLSADDFQSVMVPYSEAADAINQSDVQVSVGGPIIKDKFGLQMTGRYRLDRGHLIGRDLFAPSDSSQFLNSGLPSNFWVIESTGSGDFVSMSGVERLSLNSTLNYKLGRTTFEYNLFLQDGNFPGFSHGSKYVPTGLNTGYFSSQTHILSARYAVGSKSFGTVSYSLLRDKYDSYLYESPFDNRHQSSQLSSLAGQNAFAVGGNDLFQVDELTQTHTLLADFSSQLNNVHLAKAGILARFHSLDNTSFGIEKSSRTRFQPQPSPDRFAGDSLKASPLEFSAYIQDKMEFTGLIVNAGLRFDYFDPDYAIPVKWQQADAEEVAVTTIDPNTGLEVPTGQTTSNREDADVKMQLSPRLGIAFPISSTGVMRFSAGLFFQTPSLSLLYTNPEFEVNPASSSNQFGNANLDPERTLSFEVGLQQGLTDNMGLELTIFSKDVRNLTGQEIARLPNGDFAVRWINRDYGTIRGLTFSLFQQPGANLSWTLDYTLQFAEGTSSDPGEAFGRQQSGLDPILSLVRLNWDRRHVLNSTVTVTPVEGLQVTMINRLRSGEPYTTVRDFVRSTLTNNDDRPLQFFSDLRAYYSLPFTSRDVQAFLQVENLFDVPVQYAVYASTGNAEESLEKELVRQTGGAVGGLNSLDEFFYRQDWYSPPRRISLGLNVKF